MKLKLLSAAIAATFLAGCSSSGSSDSTSPEPQIGVADVTYNEELHTAYVQGDEGKNAIVIGDGNGNAAITIDGEAFTVQGDVVKNSNGDIVGTVVTNDGVATVYIDDMAYALAVANGRLIVEGTELKPDFGETPDWGPEFGDDEWGPESAPTYGDIHNVGGAIIVKGDGDNKAIVRIDEMGNALVFINDYDTGFVVVDSDIVNAEGEVIGSASREGDNYIVRLNDGTEVVFRNDNGRLFAAIVNRPDIDNDLPTVDEGIGADAPKWIESDFYLSEGDLPYTYLINIDGQPVAFAHIGLEGNLVVRDENGNEIAKTGTVHATQNYVLAVSTLEDSGHRSLVLVHKDTGLAKVFSLPNNPPSQELPPAIKDKNLTAEQKAEMKAKIQSLSQEQRQQIKQAIKDRVSSRS